MCLLALFLFLLVPIDSFSKANDFQLSTGINYTSESVYRGALRWPAPSIMPLLGIKYKNLSINGPGFGLNFPIQPLTFSFGLTYFNDERPLIPLKKRAADFRNQRGDVLDGHAGILWEFIPRFKFSMTISRALSSHQGIYSLTNLQIPLIFFFSTGYGIGLADNKANQFAYGPEAISGLSHRDFNLTFTFPLLPFKGILVAKYIHSKIHQAKNRNASYVLPTDNPEIISILATWPI